MKSLPIASLAIVLVLSVTSAPSRAVAAECPIEWDIPQPRLVILWDSNTKSYSSNFGERFAPLFLGDPRPLSFDSNFTSGGQEVKFREFFGDKLLAKLRTEGGNVGLRGVLAIDPTFADISAIQSYEQVNAFPIFWDYSTRSFVPTNISLLLRQGLLVKDIEGKTAKYFLEITKRGCPDKFTLVSTAALIPKTGISQEPIGLDSWSKSAEKYLKAKFETNLKRNVNWLTFDSNLRKFKELLIQIASKSKTNDPPIRFPVELKPVTYLGEDDLQFMPYLMGIPRKSCLWDRVNINYFYYYLDDYVTLQSTPCTVIAFAPDFGNISPDLDYSKSAWNNLVVVEKIEIETRKKLTRSEAISLFQPIVEKLVKARVAVSQKDIDDIYEQFVNEISTLGLEVTYFQSEGRRLIYLEIARTEFEAKAAAELKAKQEAEAKAAAELKAKQEAEAKAAAELKAKQEAEAKAAAELKAKQEAEAKAAAELKAKQEAEAAAAKKITITCVKGKTIKKVTAVKAKCPKGYQKK